MTQAVYIRKSSFYNKKFDDTDKYNKQARRKGFCLGGGGNLRWRRDVYSWGLGGGGLKEPPEALQFHSFKGHRLA